LNLVGNVGEKSHAWPHSSIKFWKNFHFQRILGSTGSATDFFQNFWGKFGKNDNHQVFRSKCGPMTKVFWGAALFINLLLCYHGFELRLSRLAVLHNDQRLPVDWLSCTQKHFLSALAMSKVKSSSSTSPSRYGLHTNRVLTASTNLDQIPFV